MKMKTEAAKRVEEAKKNNEQTAKQKTYSGHFVSVCLAVWAGVGRGGGVEGALCMGV